MFEGNNMKFYRFCRLIMWRTGVGGQTEDNIERDFAITLPPIEDIESEQVR